MSSHRLFSLVTPITPSYDGQVRGSAVHEAQAAGRPAVRRPTDEEVATDGHREQQ
jgi:hypothetical protein